MAMKIEDLGLGNECRFDAAAFADGAELILRGNGNRVEIGDDVDLRAPRIHIEGDGNVIRLATELVSVEDPTKQDTGPFLLHISDRKPEIAVLGDGNTIECGRYVELYDSKIHVVGNRNAMRLGHRVRAHMSVSIHTNGACFEVGDDTTSVAMQAALHEPNTLRLGRDCQLASDVYLTVSDTHSIVDVDTGARLNHGRDVEVGDHVWLGYRTAILKGSKIGSGSVIGTCAVVTGEVPANCVAVGNPLRVVRENATWTRELIDVAHVVDAVG